MTTDAPVLAARLLDAQVAWVLEELSGDRLQAVIQRDVDDLMAVGASVPLQELVTVEDVTRVVTHLLTTVPASTAVSTMVETWTAVVHEGPAEGVALSDLMSREHAEALVTEILGLHPVVEQALDRVTDSPMVGTLASRFITRIVSDVLQANRSVAEKIPGMGSMMNLGTSAASKVIGAADKPLQQLVGDPANRGAAFAVRRLNKVVLDTLKDPQLKAAIMEVWDQHATEALDDPGRVVPLEDVQRIAALVQEIVIAAAPTPPVTAFVEAFATAFHEVYGGHPVTVLLEELGITREDIVAELTVLLPRAIDAARADGRLEDAVRTRLEPFFSSPSVMALLQD